MGFPIATTVSAASAFLSAVAASASWLAARKANAASEEANVTAQQANATAEVLTAIERDRRHSELRPVIDIKPPEKANDRDVLRFHFTGPAELEPLGPLTVTITVRDDRDRSKDRIYGNSPTREQVAATIWGPYRLRPRVDEADEKGRTTAPRTVAVGEELLSSIDPTTAPSWYAGGQEGWKRDYEGKLMRLRIVVTCPGFEPWVFLPEVSPWRKAGPGVFWL